MSRLHRKCFCASLTLHGLLLLLVVFGAGFVASRDARDAALPVLTFVPDILTDQEVMGGGSPQVKTPVAPPAQSLPQPPAAQPQPEPQAKAAPPEPLPPKQAIDPKPVTPKPKSLPKPPKIVEPEKPTDQGTRPAVKPKPEVNLKPVIRKPNPEEERRRQEREAAAAEAAAQAAAQAARERYAKARSDRVNGIVSDLSRSLTPGVSIQTPGPGGGGASYANYDLFVQSVYQWAWRPPVDVTAESSKARVRVVVRRDGTIASAEIIEKSGIAALDRSIRTVLDRVATVGRPFPAGATEERRSYVITFDLNAKRATG